MQMLICLKKSSLPLAVNTAFKPARGDRSMKLYSQVSMLFWKTVPYVQWNVSPVSEHEYKPKYIPKGNAYICTYWSRAFFGLSAVRRGEPEMKSSPRKSCSTCCWYSPGLWDLATLSEFTFVCSPWREVLHHSYRSSVSYASTFLNICQFK